MTDKVKEEQKSNKIEVEVQAELVTGKVQEATLKKDSALSVRYIYRKILGIMKKVFKFNYEILRDMMYKSIS